MYNQRACILTLFSLSARIRPCEVEVLCFELELFQAKADSITEQCNGTVLLSLFPAFCHFILYIKSPRKKLKENSRLQKIWQMFSQIDLKQTLTQPLYLTRNRSKNNHIKLNLVHLGSLTTQNIYVTDDRTGIQYHT